MRRSSDFFLSPVILFDSVEPPSPPSISHIRKKNSRYQYGAIGLTLSLKIQLLENIYVYHVPIDYNMSNQFMSVQWDEHSDQNNKDTHAQNDSSLDLQEADNEPKQMHQISSQQSDIQPENHPETNNNTSNQNPYESDSDNALETSHLITETMILNTENDEVPSSPSHDLLNNNNSIHAEAQSMDNDADLFSPETSQTHSNFNTDNTTSPVETVPDFNIEIEVKNPETQTDGSNSYTIYHIIIKTDNKKINNSNYEIVRRYSDFDILYKSLTFDYPTLLIPPLPNKQRLEYIKGGRFTSEFVMKRCHSLHLFLNRLIHHPVLKKADILFVFLNPNANIWNNFKVNLNLTANEHLPTPMASNRIEGLTEFLMNSFKKPHLVSQYEGNFKEINMTKGKLQENLHKIDKIYSKILNKQASISHELSSFGDEFNKLTILLNNNLNGKFRSEEDLNKNDKNMVTGFKKFSSNLKGNSNEYSKLNKFIEFNYLNNLKDLEHYLISFDNLLKLKDNKVLDYEMLNNYLEKSVQEKENLQNGGKLTSTTEGTISFLSKKLEFLTGKPDSAHDEGSLVDSRIHKLEKRIELLQSEKEVSKQIYEKFETDLLEEWATFQKIKNDEIVDSLNDLSQSYLHFYENSYNDWKEFTIQLESLDNSNLNSELQLNLDNEQTLNEYFNDDQIDNNHEEIQERIKNIEI